MTHDPTAYRGEFGQFVSPYNAAFREDVRVDYETTKMTLADIADKYKIAGSTIHAWARTYDWVMRQPHRIDPNDLVGRMMGLLDRQIADLETAMTNGATEIAMLSKLVTTLDRVIALKDRTVKAEKPASRKVQSLRARIADRLAELNRA